MNFKIVVVGFSGEFLPSGLAALKRLHRVLVSHELLEAVHLAAPELSELLSPYRRFSEALEALEEARKEDRPLGLVASGDPLFFGAGRVLVRRFGKERVALYPAPSFAQKALARLGYPLEDYFFVSLHGGKRAFGLEDLPGLLRLYGKVGVFTDPDLGPREMARFLVEKESAEGVTLIVAQRVGLPGEAFWQGSPEEALRKDFAYPHLVFLHYEGPGRERGLGLSTAEISHPRGLITKEEVRAVVLHALRLPERGVLWDIGAGAGGVSVEAARAFPLLRVFSVERSPEALDHLRKNRRRLGLFNLEVVAGEAPEALEGLPTPDRVFIGGSGGRLEEILDLALERSRGPVVLTLVLLSHLHRVLALARRRAFSPKLSQISVCRARPLGPDLALFPETPVFVVSLEPEDGGKG
ncbi:precorrin-6Y C5,15-methyltransferase (decarboxylating) subunit CbiT [Thermosulfurimonas marina]|uniref:Precorrin-6Y C5,15-methyltransferase (Decarboxylating) subunit CbiT n=1 Tax=Thermosulfurimonas marina TaxID=2047767 RepID=A0A6H1WT83_9BACT|nr:precorrin-6Y C5,15-methyltransferase (decarboxylating) subunit CbiT [Thermosulfurimonas marina]QJA06427.1 precorrin-6Y C5,15-methyltransferase (decarboxylating) subunit CbiT [Thermosulfurimonas marina]